MKYILFFKIKFFTFSVSFFLLISSSAEAIVDAVTPTIDSKAYVLMDYHSGEILVQYNAQKRVNPASLTQIMTSYAIGHAIKARKIDPDDLVTVRKNAWITADPTLCGPSLMFLQPGDQINVQDLNKAIVIQSADDASIALADYIAGNQDNFISLMNNYARLLGLKNTHFLTVHGLNTPEEYSTALDMAILWRALIRDVPQEYALHQEKEFIYNDICQLNDSRHLRNNKLTVDGIKTGYTAEAGYNLIASATKGSMRLISVVLSAPTDSVRYSDSEKLLNWGFRVYETVVPVKTDEPVFSQRVWLGDIKNVNLGAEKDIAITIPRGQEKDLKVSYTFEMTELLAPLARHQKVGTLDFQLNGKVIEQRPLVVLNEVKRGHFFSRTWDFLMMKLCQLFS